MIQTIVCAAKPTFLARHLRRPATSSLQPDTLASWGAAYHLGEQGLLLIHVDKEQVVQRPALYRVQEDEFWSGS